MPPAEKVEIDNLTRSLMPIIIPWLHNIINTYSHQVNEERFHVDIFRFNLHENLLVQNLKVCSAEKGQHNQ